MLKIPIRLTKDPIIEAVFELRFRSKQPSVADILLGTLFTPFKDRFDKVERLPFADFPRQIQDLDPNLRYQPRLRLSGDRFQLAVGDQSVALVSQKPYAGWGQFRPLIVDVLQHVKDSGVVDLVERFGVRYLNLLEAKTPAEQFKMIRYDAKLAGYKLTEFLMNTKTEFVESEFTNVVELTSNTNARIADGSTFYGLLFSIDTICKNPTDFWNDVERHINKAHDQEKKIFFETLTPEAIAQFGAVWS